MTDDTDRPRPFCGDKAARLCFDRWVERLQGLGVDVGAEAAEAYVVGLLASREARLEALVVELRRERDAGRKLRLVAAERLAAADMQKALDVAERVFGAAVGEAVAAPAVRATGTDGGRVLAFAPEGRGLSPVAQRVAAAVAKAGRPLTKDVLRRRVQGSEDDFLRGLREVMQAGAVKRNGRGRKGSPFTYSRGDR